MPDHPIQPLVKDHDGRIRFKENHLISAMLDVCSKHGLGLNEIARGDWNRDDYDQFLQLVGYSVAGAPLSRACRARIPEFDERSHTAATFTEGFCAGYAQARRDVISTIEDMEAR